MKFPITERHRKQTATIYGKTSGSDSYRVSWTAGGKRQMKSFGKYGDAKAWAYRIVRELAEGSSASALSPKDAGDALVARQALDAHFVATGRRVTLLRSVVGYLDADKALDGRPLGVAVDHFIATSVSIKRVTLAAAVVAFLAVREPLTKAKPGERPQLSPKYFYNQGNALREFAATLPGNDVCDLNRELIGAFMATLADFAPKTRNHRRASIKQLLAWCVRQDYLAGNHRIDEADAMAPELANQAEIEFYTTDEFRTLLTSADSDLLPMLAIGGLAGLRTVELLRLDWSEVWRVAGHVEITAGKAKTRQRRLVEVCASLESWLNPYRATKTGAVWPLRETEFHVKFKDLCEQAGMKRKPNGLRHAFCSFHYALHSNENLTAAQAGNSPTMIHGHYKGLATKPEAERWFNVAPAQAGNVVSMAATLKG